MSKTPEFFEAELLIALTKIKEFEAEIEKKNAILERKNFQINELIKLIDQIKIITAKLNFI